MQDEMNDWYSDDMTFCSRKGCYARCERHPSNIRCPDIPHSYSDFYDTDYCPIHREKSEMQDELKLKPCPFCGGEATPVYCEHGSQYTANVYYPLKRGTVKCKRCEIRLPRTYSRVSKAVEAWNRRA